MRSRPPTITPRPDEKSLLSVLLSPDTKSKIIAASELAARSLSSEASFRLENSFITENLLSQASGLAWNGNSPLVFLLGEVLNKFTPKAEWSTDEWSQITITRAISRTLTVLFDIELALKRFAPDLDKRDRDYVDKGSPEDRVDFFLHQLGDDTAWGRTKRERLAELADRLIVWHDAVEATDYIKARRSGETAPPVVNVDSEDMWDRAFGSERIAQDNAAARERSGRQLRDEAATDEARRRRQRKSE